MIENLIKKIKFKKSGIIVIDNFLPEYCCQYLRNYAINPNGGYHDVYDGYRAINFLNQIGQFHISDIANSFSKKIEFLGNLGYTRSWCFSYDNKCAGVPAHADPSYININLWLTPDECINDTSKNGLKVYCKKRNKSDSHEDYNRNREYINSQIKNSKYTVVPYKYNRATIFFGSMYHETMGVDMKEGDDNKRVSYTFLFDKVEI